jgi:ribosomal protein L1
MNEEVFNIEIRKFLKQVGVTSQRVIEEATRDAVKAGKLKGSETLNAHVTLTIDGIGVTHKIDGTIKLG